MCRTLPLGPASFFVSLICKHKVLAMRTFHSDAKHQISSLNETQRSKIFLRDHLVQLSLLCSMLRAAMQNSPISESHKQV